jgi:hypothetical protein
MMKQMLPRFTPIIKNFVARLYLFMFVVIVIVIQSVWLALIYSGPSLVMKLMFPVLLVVGSVIHFRRK